MCVCVRGVGFVLTVANGILLPPSLPETFLYRSTISIFDIHFIFTLAIFTTDLVNGIKRAISFIIQTFAAAAAISVGRR